MKKLLISFILALSFGAAQAWVIGDPVLVEPRVEFGLSESTGQLGLRFVPESGVIAVRYFATTTTHREGSDSFAPFPVGEIKRPDAPPQLLCQIEVEVYDTNGIVPTKRWAQFVGGVWPSGTDPNRLTINFCRERIQ